MRSFWGTKLRKSGNRYNFVVTNFWSLFDKPSHSDTCIHSSTNTQACRKRGGRGGMCPPILGRSVNPISTRGVHIMHTTLLCAPPDFQTLRRP